MSKLKSLFILLTLTLFIACQKEDKQTDTWENKVEVNPDSLVLNVNINPPVGTKAYEINDVINNVNLFVFGYQGQKLYHQYFSTASNLKVIAATGPKTFIAIANAGDVFADVTSLEDLRARKHTGTLGVNNSIVYSGETDKYITPQDRSININIKRMLSKLTFVFDKSQLDPGISLNITKIELKNVPRSCKYLGLNTPTIADINANGDYLDTNLEPMNHLTASPLYLYENLQGVIGSATQPKDKNPGAKASVSSYVEITASYQSQAKTGTVKYRYWLGADHLTNFDVNREVHYKETIRFKGTAVSDPTWSSDQTELTDVTYNITASTNPVGAATITGTGQYLYGQTPSLSVVPATNYVFTGWSPTISPVTGNRHYVANFTYNDPSTYVSSITVTLSKSTLNVSESTSAFATVGPWNASNKTVVWSSSNTSVATVNSMSGVVTAVGNGSCSIIATATDGTGVTGSAPLTVSVPVSSITVNLAQNTLTTIGSTTTATATVQPWNATNKTVSWSSSNTSVATVNSSGVVTAVGNGSCSIIATATDGTGISGSAPLTVNVPVNSISVSLSQGTLTTVGSTTTATASVLPSTAANKTVVWSSSNTSVATVNSSGVVTAVGSGSCSIIASATDGTGKSGNATLTVTLSVPVNSITVTLGAPKIKVNETTTATATVLPVNATNKNVAWSSSNTAIASVNSLTGAVFGEAAGTCNIIATATDGSGVIGMATIIIDPATVKVEAVTLNKSVLHLDEGTSEGLIASVYPGNAEEKGLTWSSSNTSVATVSTSGVVTAKSKGTAIITALSKDNSGVYKAECTVNVYKEVTVSVQINEQAHQYNIETDNLIYIEMVLSLVASDAIPAVGPITVDYSYQVPGHGTVTGTTSLTLYGSSAIVQLAVDGIIDTEEKLNFAINSFTATPRTGSAYTGNYHVKW